MVKLSMGPNATDEKRAEGANAVSKLEKKLVSTHADQNIIRGQLRQIVKSTIKLYNESAKAKDLKDSELGATEKERVKAANVAQMRATYDKFTREQLGVVKFSMVLDATTEQVADGAKASPKFRKKLESIYHGEKVISGQLRDEMTATLKLYYELKKKES